MSKKNLIRIVISLLIGVALILLWLKLVDLNEIFSQIKSARITFVIPAICFYLMSYYFRSQRLRLLLSNKVNIPVFKNYTYVLAGNFLNYIIPIRAGDIGKSIFYKKNHNLRYSESLPSIFIDKIFDTYAIFVVLLLIPFTQIEIATELRWLILLLVFVFFVGFLILFIASKSKDRAAKILQKLFFFAPKRLKEKINSFIALFVEGIGIFSHRKAIILPSLLFTFMATLTDSICFYYMFVAVGVPILFIEVLLGYTLIFLSYILPHPPAQIGSNEGIMLIIFTAGFGIVRNNAGAVMVLSHIVTATVIFITGTLSLAFAGIRFKDIMK